MLRSLVIPTIYTAVDRMSATVTRMEATMTHFTTVAGAQGAALATSLNNTSIAAKSVATSAALMGAAVLIPLGLASKAAMDFEQQMSNVNTLMDSSTESITAMSDAVLKMAQKTPVPIHDLTESLYQIRSEGFKGAQALDILGTSARLSVAGLSTATEAAKSMATAIRVFGDEGLTTAQIADTFFKTVSTGRTTMAQINESFGTNAAIVHEAGVGFKEFQAATATLTNAGLTASEAQTAIKGSTLALLKPTGEMTKAFHALGITTGKELIGKLGGLVPALDAVGTMAHKMGLNVNKEFGRVQGLVAYTLLTGSLRQKFDEDLSFMTNGIDKMSEAYQKQLGTTAAQAQIAKNNLQTLGIRIGELLLPALTAIVKVLTPVIQGLTSFAHNHKLLSGIVVGSIAGFGAFSIAVAGISFAVYGVTKAIWLWNIGLKVLAATQAFVAVMTNNLTGDLLAQAGAARGATVAIKLLEAGFSGLGVIGVVTAALVGLGIALGDDYKALYDQTDGLKDLRNGMLQSVEPINSATLALQEYNKAKQTYNDLVQFKQVQKYEHSKGFLPGLKFDIINAFKHPSLTGMASGPAEVFDPKVSDYKALDTTKVQHQFIEGDTTGHSGAMALPAHNSAIHINLNVDKNNELSASATTGNTTVPVTIDQTGITIKPRYTA